MRASAWEVCITIEEILQERSKFSVMEMSMKGT